MTLSDDFDISVISLLVSIHLSFFVTQFEIFLVLGFSGEICTFSYFYSEALDLTHTICFSGFFLITALAR